MRERTGAKGGPPGGVLFPGSVGMAREDDIMQMHYVEPSEGRPGPARGLALSGGSFFSSL